MIATIRPTVCSFELIKCHYPQVTQARVELKELLTQWGMGGKSVIGRDRALEIAVSIREAHCILASCLASLGDPKHSTISRYNRPRSLRDKLSSKLSKFQVGL